MSQFPSSSSNLSSSSSSTTARRFVPNLSQQEVDELREAFDLFDTDDKGRISGKELREVLLSLLPSSGTNGIPAATTTTTTNGKYESIRLLLQKMEHQDVELDFNEFVAVVTNDREEPCGENDEDAGVRRVFNLFDHDKKGYITLIDLKQVAEELGETMDENELQEMLDRASTNGDGKIRFEEFRNVMTKKLFFADNNNNNK